MKVSDRRRNERRVVSVGEDEGREIKGLKRTRGVEKNTKKEREA